MYEVSLTYYLRADILGFMQKGDLKFLYPIGKVTYLSVRLCGETKAGQTQVAQTVHGEIESLLDAEPVEVTLKGIGAVSAFNVLRMRG